MQLDHAGGQWQRSLDMLRKLTEGGHKPQAGTITAVFDSLGAAKQAEPAQALLKELSAQVGQVCTFFCGPRCNLWKRARRMVMWLRLA